MKYTYETLLDEAKKYTRRTGVDSFKAGSPKHYHAAIKRGLMDSLCEHMPPPRVRHTKEDALKKMASCSTRTEFKEKFKGEYQFLLKRHKVDYEAAASSLECGKSKPRRWTYDSLTKEASKYETRSMFRHSNEGAYRQALASGEMDSICSHMIKGHGSSDNDAVYIWRVIGTDIYKIGVTSARFSDMRIATVAASAGLDAEIIVLTAIKGKATDVEFKLHTYFNDKRHSFSKVFDGSTEFFELDSYDIITAKEFIHEYR